MPNDANIPIYYKPHLAVFCDWYIYNEKTDEACGLLGCTISQANSWVVSHLDLSLNWGIIWSEDMKKVLEIQGESK